MFCLILEQSVVTQLTYSLIQVFMPVQYSIEFFRNTLK